jgi:hypothetical protein
VSCPAPNRLLLPLVFFVSSSLSISARATLLSVFFSFLFFFLQMAVSVERISRGGKRKGVMEKEETRRKRE